MTRTDCTECASILRGADERPLVFPGGDWYCTAPSGPWLIDPIDQELGLCEEFAKIPEEEK